MTARRTLVTFCVTLGIALGSSCQGTSPVQVLIPVSVAITPSDTFLPQFGTVQLDVSVLDTAGQSIPVHPTFTVSDSTIISVSASGVVTSLGSIGTATVEAKLGPLEDYAVIRVHDSSLVRVKVPDAAYGAAIAANGAAYVTQTGLGLVRRVNLASHVIDAAVTVGSIPTEIAFNTTGTLAYVTGQYSHNVSVVQVGTNTRIDSIPVTGDPFEVIVAPGDSIIYVSTNVDSVYGIRLSSKAVVTAFPTPAIGNGFVIRDTLLYVSTHAGGTVIEFNLKTRVVGRTFAVGGTPQKMALSADGNELYIANEAGYVQFWDRVSGTQIGSNLPLTPGSQGYGMARRPSDGQLYVTSAYFGGGNIHIINPVTRTLTRTIVAGGSTRRVVFNASGSVGFVPNESGWIDFLK